jgi:hydroxymethylpyrimidine/phosphomethylpyrimidine kinase
VRAERKQVISIAGFDPSAGAGILADIKTFEQLGVYGFGVCSAITLQTEDEFKGIAWIPVHQIELQLDTLLQKYDVKFLKIGLIQTLEVLDELVQTIRRKYPSVKMIWDPILRTSSGFQVFQKAEERLLYEILSQVYLVTPNSDEAKNLMHAENALLAAKEIGRFTNVFLKSYSDSQQEHCDILIEKGREYFFQTEMHNGYEKHGSGCVLSAAIAASLAKGHDLKFSCGGAKAYTLEFLKSSEGLLGEHHRIKLISQHA